MRTTMEIKEGDRVRYAKHWLRSCGIYTGDVPFLRGRVIRLQPFGSDGDLATVRWDHNLECGGDTSKVLSANLEHCR